VDHHELGLAARLLVLRGGDPGAHSLGPARAPDPLAVRRRPRGDRTGGYLAIYLCALAIALLGLTALAIFTLTTRASGPARG